MIFIVSKAERERALMKERALMTSVQVGVMNTTEEAIVITVGAKYGSFSRIIDIAHHSEHPFRVAVINGANVLHHLHQDEHNGPGKKKKTAQETA
jgi:hypothetical protein